MIPPKQIEILKHLGSYKFLSRKQLGRLGVSQYTSALSKLIRPLLQADWIGVTDATHFGIGHIYYLKRKGASFLQKELHIEPSLIHYCISTPKLSPQSVFHRTGAIDCQIELTLSCQYNNVRIEFYHRDIEVVPKGKSTQSLTRKTRIEIETGKYLEPDAVFMLKTSNGRKLYCLEFENEDYTKKSFQKVKNHVIALNAKSASKKYGHDKANRVLFVYKNRSTMDAVMLLTREEIGGVENWILFKCYNEINRNPSRFDFFKGWRSSTGEECALY